MSERVGEGAGRGEGSVRGKGEEEDIGRGARREKIAADQKKRGRGGGITFGGDSSRFWSPTKMGPPRRFFLAAFGAGMFVGPRAPRRSRARSRRTSSTPTPFRVRISSAIASASSAPRAETPRWNSAAEGANRARRGDAPAPVLFAGLFLPRNVARGRLVEARPGRGEPRRGPRASASAEAAIAPRGNARRGRGRPRGWNRGAASRARRGVFCEECDTRDNENFPRQRGASGRAKFCEIVDIELPKRPFGVI